MFQKTALGLLLSLFFQTPYSLAMEVTSTPSVTPHSYTQTIAFYNSHEPFYELTNFYSAPFVEPYDLGKSNEWKTSEHYFQGHKFNYPGARHILDEIKHASTPRDAFDLARKYHTQVRPDWHGTSSMDERKVKKVQVMYAGLKMKFTSYAELAALLMSTDGCYLLENAGKNDDYWGNGANGNGKNMLGKLLMELREELFKDPSLVHGTGPYFISFNHPTISQLSGPRLDYYKYILTQLQSGQSIIKFAQYVPSVVGAPSSSVSTSVIGVKVNPHYAGPEQQGGFRQKITTSLANRFSGLSQHCPIDISHNKHLLITTASSKEAQDILQSLKNDFGMHGVNIDNIDPKKVFIRRDVINQFLSNVLNFDPHYITAFKTNFNI